MELDIIDEQIDTIGKAFMGLSIGCARCHDHKFDDLDEELLLDGRHLQEHLRWSTITSWPTGTSARLAPPARWRH